MQPPYSDDEFAALTGALRQQRGGVHMTTPIEHVVRRGHSLRARRRLPAAGALAAVAVTAAALSTTGTNSSAPPAAAQAANTAGHGAGVQQTSPYWSVSLTSDDMIDVTVHQLRDAAGLQALLRSDGLPVAVSFSGQPLSSTCRAYPASADLLWKVEHVGTPGKTATPPPAGNTGASAGSELIFNPSALPKGVGVAIYDGAPQNGAPKGFVVKIDLVHASQACTGS